LRIFTSLDPELQSSAEEIITAKAAHYRTTYGANNMALAALNPDTGEILAYVGGEDFFDEEHDGQVDVLSSRRQPGSSFKPFVYATAFAEGYSPSTVVFDTETDFGGNYQPQNFNGEFQGPVSLRKALNESLNIPAIKVAYLAGPANILKTAQKLGIKFEGDAERHGVALGVGVAEVEPLSHINAFGAFVGDGSYHTPVAILEVKDSEGNVLERADFTKNKKEGLDPEVAGLVRNILTDEASRPTTDDFDWNVLLQLDGFNNGAKTGTSNRMAENPEFDETKPEDAKENPKFITVPGDSWTIGFTPHLVAGVWVGNNRGEPMDPGATGLSVAAPVWKRFMVAAHDALIERGADKNKLYGELKPLEVRRINKYSGKLASDLTPPQLMVEEVFATFALPTDIDDSVKQIEIDKISGRPANEFTPHYAKTLKYALDLNSIKPDMPNWQNPVKEWLEKHPRFVTSLGSIMDQASDDEDANPTELSRWDTRLLGSDEKLLRDDVHNSYTKANGPKVQIVSPRNGSSIAPGPIEIKITHSAKFGMKGVEFYLDDQLVDETKLPPYIGRFEIPEKAAMGSSHVIKILALDRLLQASQDEIEVTIEMDTEGPEIQFLGPVGNQKIPLGSLIQVSANVYDSASAVQSVEFFLDDQVLIPDPTNPFTTEFSAVGPLGRRILKIVATDVHNNKNEKSIPVDFERERLVLEEKPMINNVIKYRTSASIDLVFPLPEQLEFAEIVISKGGETVFYHKIDKVSKFAQIQAPRNYEGTGTIQLMSKLKGSDEPYLSPKRELKW
ncbi:MAG TPA: penicillin-binding transpeptidase domain-containing protein, partial [Candidatus Gracilibacteria bacterium]